MPDLLVQVAGLQLQPPDFGEVQEVVQEILQSLALPLDRVHLLQGSAEQRVLRVTAEVLRQKLEVQPDRGKRVLDLVRQASGQPRDLRILIDQLLIDVVHSRIDR